MTRENSPELRFHSVLVALTVTLMYLAFTTVVPFLQGLLVHASSIQLPLVIPRVLGTVIGTVVVFMLSGGAYRLIAKIGNAQLRKVRWLTRMFLGRYDLGGTWVGYYRGGDNQLYLIVEQYKQDLVSLRISGTSYLAATKVPRTTWESDPVYINSESDALSYAYRSTPFGGEQETQGVAWFRLVRIPQTAQARSIDGFSANLSDGRRVLGKEKWVSARLDYDHGLSDALEFAHKNGET